VNEKKPTVNHRTIDRGYRLSGKNRKVGSHDSFCAPGATGTSGARRIGRVLGGTGPGRSQEFLSPDTLQEDSASGVFRQNRVFLSLSGNHIRAPSR
jgi:hypothetical protein